MSGYRRGGREPPIAACLLLIKTEKKAGREHFMAVAPELHSLRSRRFHCSNLYDHCAARDLSLVSRFASLPLPSYLLLRAGAADARCTGFHFALVGGMRGRRC